MTDNNNEIDFSWMKNQEEKFNKFMEENKKTVIISCQKLTTGVTLPLLDTILLMRSCSSAEQFVQILFRTMTSAKNKKSASLYNFDYECTLKVLRKLVSIAKAENEVSQREAIEKLLSVVRLDKAIGDKNFDFEELKADEWLKELRDIPFSYIRENVFENLDIDVNLNDLRDADLTLNKELGQRNVTEDKKTKKQGSSSNGLSEKIQIATATNDKLTESDKKKLLAIVQHIDHEIIMNNIKSFDELRSHLPSEIGESLRSAYEQLLDKNKTNVKDLIEDIWWKWDNDKLNLIENMSQYNNADKATPAELIEKMFNKLTLDDDAVYYDPCCGTGAIGLYLRSKGIDDDKIYMSDINPSHVEMCKKLGFKHVYQCDVLFEKVNIEYKHMKIIMNPPYSGNLHLKILSKIISEYPEAEVVNLSPDDWIINPLIKYTTKKCELSFREKLLPHLADLEHISLDDFNKLFGTSSFFGVGIQYYTKEGGYDYNKFINNDALTNKIWNAVTKMPSLRSKFEPLKDNDLFVHIRRRTHRTYKWTEDKINATEGIQFETKEEKENFVASLDTWIYKYLNKFPEGENSARVPYLGDYTHPWTDEMLYEYFDLTEDEVNEIEQEIK